jgi:hypothetical protein
MGEQSERHYLTDDAAMRKVIFRYSPVSQGAAMIRKTTLDRCGDYQHVSAEDLDMLFRIGRISKLANLDKVVLRCRETATSATYSRLRVMEKTTLKVRRHHLRGGYPVSLVDLLYNLAQLTTLYLLPTRMRVWLFKKLRDRQI